MALDEKVYQYAQKLPRSLQEELLNFIQYLLIKAEQQGKARVELAVVIFSHAGYGR
jgi:hypothetical protein